MDAPIASEMLREQLCLIAVLDACTFEFKDLSSFPILLEGGLSHLSCSPWVSSISYSLSLSLSLCGLSSASSGLIHGSRRSSSSKTSRDVSRGRAMSHTRSCVSSWSINSSMCVK